MDHHCIPFAPLGTDEWKLTNGKATSITKMNSRVIVNDLNLGKSMAVSGHGIALIPTYFCRQEVNEGKLVRILPEWRMGSGPVHFVYPAQKYVMPKLSAFIDLATTPIKKVFDEAT